VGHPCSPPGSPSAHRVGEIRRREAVYTEFITECSRLAIDALDHPLESPTRLVQLYGLLNRSRRTSSNAVVRAAEATVQTIVDESFQSAKSIEELRQRVATSQFGDPLEPFAEACRQQLREVVRVV
jgi:hypothetical protein